MADAEFLLDRRGVARDLGAFVVGARFDVSGAVCAFALGDGTARLTAAADPGADWRVVTLHDGAALSLAAGTAPGTFISGGDDGTLRRLGADGAAETVASFGAKWVEHVGVHADPKGSGVIAAAVGRAVHVFDGRGARLKVLEHPSSVTGIAFDAKGKRIAASHYNGASLWFVAAKVDTPRILEWKGSHIGIAVNPDGDSVVTAMQENALHGWRLSDGQHMRMSGYPAKTRSLSFSRTGKWLASSGADAIVLWPFFGGGPMGKAPTELAGGDNVLATAVAFHPRDDIVAGGFGDGLVVVADAGSARILPVAPAGSGPVSVLAWNAAGTHLAIGTEQGFAAIIDFSQR